MQAIILAAGMGKRLKELTENNTKCMVKVNGVTLIEHMLRQLDALELDRIVIVTGYKGELLVDFISTIDVSTQLVFVDNPIYDQTNNIYSLYLAKDYLLQDDTLLLESDLIFEDRILTELVEDPRDTLALVDKYESWMDGTVIKIDADDNITDFVPGKQFVFEDIPQYYKTVNIYKFGREFSEKYYVPFLEAYSTALGKNEYYEQVLKVITMLDKHVIKAKRLEGQTWYEIDDIQDLDIASSMFAPDEKTKIKLIQKRYGGYWRYPKMIDFCYLVNPYFPPKRLLNEMQANFEKLMVQYPSGLEVNSLLAAKNFNMHLEHIVVGNGAAEIIKSIMENLDGKCGFIRPTFEEYPNRYTAENSVVYVPENNDFAYNADDIIDYFSDKDIKTLLVINPDNPSGNYLNRNNMMKVLDWSAEKGIRLIIDESFVDFADDEECSLISEDVINMYKHAIIVKSISKSYGVPGVRLGIAVAADEQLIKYIKKDMAIWNINSFGEFYMQIAGKYESDYRKSLVLLKESRTRLVEGLKDFSDFHVIPSQANYVMVDIGTRYTATELTCKLLTNYNIFIKDLSDKIVNGKQYIRIAVRDDADNAKLLSALKEVYKL